MGVRSKLFSRSEHKANSSSSLAIAICAILLSAATSLMLTILGPAILASGTLLVSLVLILYTTYSALRIENNVDGPDAFSVLKLTAVYFVLNGIVGALYFTIDQTSRSKFGYSYEDLAWATFLTAVCWVFLCVGYLGSSFPRINGWAESVLSTRQPVVARLIVGSLVGWGARAILVAQGRYFHVTDDTSTLQSDSTTFITNTISQVPLIVLFAAVAMLGVKPLRKSPVAMLLLVSELAWALPSGARANIIVLLLGLVVVRYYVSGLRVPRAWLIVGLILGALAFPLIANFRDATGAAGVEAASTLDGSKLVSGNSSGGFFASVPETVASRFSDLESFSVSLHSGESTLEILPLRRFLELSGATAVPRPIWPNKPDPNLFGNEFGRKSGIIWSGDETTSINVPLPLQWWMVGGVFALILGSALTGTLLKLMNSLFRVRFSGVAGVAIYAVSALNISTICATILPANAAGLLKTMAFYLLTLYLLTSRSEDQSKERAEVPTVREG